MHGGVDRALPIEIFGPRALVEWLVETGQGLSDETRAALRLLAEDCGAGEGAQTHEKLLDSLIYHCQRDLLLLALSPNDFASFIEHCLADAGLGRRVLGLDDLDISAHALRLKLLKYYRWLQAPVSGPRSLLRSAHKEFVQADELLRRTSPVARTAAAEADLVAVHGHLDRGLQLAEAVLDELMVLSTALLQAVSRHSPPRLEKEWARYGMLEKMLALGWPEEEAKTAPTGRRSMSFLNPLLEMAADELSKTSMAASRAVRKLVRGLRVAVDADGQVNPARSGEIFRGFDAVREARNKSRHTHHWAASEERVPKEYGEAIRDAVKSLEDLTNLDHWPLAVQVVQVCVGAEGQYIVRVLTEDRERLDFLYPTAGFLSSLVRTPGTENSQEARGEVERLAGGYFFALPDPRRTPDQGPLGPLLLAIPKKPLCEDIPLRRVQRVDLEVEPDERPFVPA
ncbi:MAG: hypothetical protein ONB23_08440 [candidate division KSB1 bacterium]|nr:hypothetical protein [candidate division KSB1 bacterium]